MDTPHYLSGECKVPNIYWVNKLTKGTPLHPDMTGKALKAPGLWLPALISQDLAKEPGVLAALAPALLYKRGLCVPGHRGEGEDFLKAMFIKQAQWLSLDFIIYWDRTKEPSADIKSAFNPRQLPYWEQ